MTSSPSLERESPHLATGAVAGIDEVGRGALAGPVMVGVVLVTTLKPVPSGLRDSKLLTEKRREELAPVVAEWADAWAIGAASNTEIDQWGIRTALAIAADRALAALPQVPSHLMIDGPTNLLRAPINVAMDVSLPPAIRFRDLPVTTVVKGDQQCATIAGAALLAKVTRDRLMVEYATTYPQYGWEGNKGYGSEGHRAAIERFGPTPLHRLSWKLL